MWNWLLPKFSKLFSSGKDIQGLPNVVVTQQLPVTKTETPIPKVNTPAKTKVDKHIKPSESKYKSTVQSESNAIKVDNSNTLNPYTSATHILYGSDDSSCPSKSYSNSDYSSSSSSSSSSSCD